MTASSNSPTPSEQADANGREAFLIEAGENWSQQNISFATSRIREELVLGLIKEADVRESTSLDLNGKELRKIPDTLLELKHLERLILEGNEIKELPENFFDCFPNLIWLDLRNNSLQYLPSIYIGRHKKLRNLLLQGNQLRTLPLELGFVKSLNGLNICNNPLDFPPIEVIGRGTQEVLKFLREVLLAKSEERNKVAVGRSLASTGTDTSDIRQRAKSENIIRQKSESIVDNSASSADERPAEYILRRNTPEEVFQCSGDTRETEGLYGHYDDDRNKTGAVGEAMLRGDEFEMRRNKPRRASSYNSRKSSNKDASTPEYFPSGNEYVTFKMAEDRRNAKHRDYKIKENAILQRRRDEELLKQWREESKVLQQKKAMEVEAKRREGSMRRGSPFTFTKPTPYGVDKDHMRVLTNEQRIKEDVRLRHERLRDYHDRHANRHAVENERINVIHDLEKKIKSHTQKMFERRKHPSSNPHEEVEAARRDLQTAEKLQLELIIRKRRRNNRLSQQPFD